MSKPSTAERSVALGSAGREGAGWLETNAARSEFHKVCKRLDKAKDDAHEHEILHTEVRVTVFCGSRRRFGCGRFGVVVLRLP